MDTQSFVAYGDFKVHGVTEGVVLPHLKKENVAVSYPYHLPVQHVYQPQPFNKINFPSYETITTPITEIKEPEAFEKIHGYEKTLDETKNNQNLQKYTKNYVEVIPSVYLKTLNGDVAEYNNLQFVTNSKNDAESESVKDTTQPKPVEIHQDDQDLLKKSYKCYTVPITEDASSKTSEFKKITIKQPKAYIPSEFKCSFPSATFPRHPSYEILAWQVNSGTQRTISSEPKEKKKRNFFLGKSIKNPVFIQSDKSFQQKSKTSFVPVVNKDELKIQKNSLFDKTSFSFFSCCNKKNDELKNNKYHTVLKTYADESDAKLEQVTKTEKVDKFLTRLEKDEERQMIEDYLKEKRTNEEVQRQNKEIEKILFEEQLEKNKLKEQLELQLKEHLEKQLKEELEKQVKEELEKQVKEELEEQQLKDKIERQQLREELEKQPFKNEYNDIKCIQNFVSTEIESNNLKKVINNQIKEVLESQYREEACEYERIMDIMQNQCIQQQQLASMLEQQRDKQKRLADDLELQFKTQERLKKSVEHQNFNQNVQQKVFIKEEKIESTSNNSDSYFLNCLEEQMNEYCIVLDRLKQQEQQYQELNEKLKWQEQLSEKLNEDWLNFCNQNEALQIQKMKLYNSLKNVQEQLRLHIKCLYNFKHNKIVQETEEIDELLRNFCISAAEVLKQNTDGLTEELPDIELIQTPVTTKQAIQVEKKKKIEDKQENEKLEKKLDKEILEKGSQIKVKKKKKIDIDLKTKKLEKKGKKPKEEKIKKLGNDSSEKNKDAIKQIKRTTKYMNPSYDGQERSNIAVSPNDRNQNVLQLILYPQTFQKLYGNHNLELKQEDCGELGSTAKLIKEFISWILVPDGVSTQEFNEKIKSVSNKQIQK